MPDRITLNKTTYMPVEGQWQVVLSGSVMDVPDHTAYKGSADLTTKDVGTTLVKSGHANKVSNFRTQG